MEYLWQIGVLLMGLGVFFALVHLGLLLKETKSAVVRANIILDQNRREIDEIILNIASLTTTADQISTSITNFSPVKLFMGINNVRKKNARDFKNRRKK